MNKTQPLPYPINICESALWTVKGREEVSWLILLFLLSRLPLSWESMSRPVGLAGWQLCAVGVEGHWTSACTCLGHPHAPVALSSWAQDMGPSKMWFHSALRRKLSPITGPLATGWAIKPVCWEFQCRDQVSRKDQQATFLEISKEAYGKAWERTFIHSLLLTAQSARHFSSILAHRIPQPGEVLPLCYRWRPRG